MAELFASAFVAAVFKHTGGKGSTRKFANNPRNNIITVILSYILLVFGGILPKRLARNNPEKTAYRLIGILQILAIINIPFEKLIKV